MHRQLQAVSMCSSNLIYHTRDDTRYLLHLAQRKTIGPFSELTRWRISGVYLASRNGSMRSGGIGT